MILHKMIHTIPRCIRYTCTHEYISTVNNIATIGFTPFMSYKLRHSVFVKTYVKVGDNLTQGQSLLRVETSRFYKEMVMPVDGKIININPDWTIQCKLDKGSNQSGTFMSLAEYTKHINTLL